MFIALCAWVVLYVHLCTAWVLCVPATCRSQEDVHRSCWTGITDGCEVPCPAKEQPMLLIFEPLLVLLQPSLRSSSSTSVLVLQGWATTPSTVMLCSKVLVGLSLERTVNGFHFLENCICLFIMYVPMYSQIPHCFVGVRRIFGVSTKWTQGSNSDPSGWTIFLASISLLFVSHRWRDVEGPLGSCPLG